MLFHVMGYQTCPSGPESAVLNLTFVLKDENEICFKKYSFQLKGDQTEICKHILAKGDLQVSEKERQAQQEAMFKGEVNY